MKKLQLTDVKSGSLVSRIREERIEFIHEGEEYEVDVLIKTLPFIETESLQKRMNNKEEVVYHHAVFLDFHVSPRTPIHLIPFIKIIFILINSHQG